MKNKIIYSALLVLQILLYVGAYIVHYFTVRKLGMNRYMAYLNKKIEMALPIQEIIDAGVMVLLVSTLVLSCLAMRHRKKIKKIFILMFIVVMITVLLYCYYAIVVDVQMRRAYYVLCILFLLGGTIQLVKMGICMRASLKL